MDKRWLIWTFAAVLLMTSSASARHLWGNNSYVAYVGARSDNLFPGYNYVVSTAGFRDVNGVIGQKDKDYIVGCFFKDLNDFNDDFKGKVRLYRVVLDYSKLRDSNNNACVPGIPCDFCKTPTCDPETCHDLIPDNKCRVEGGGTRPNPFSVVPRQFVFMREYGDCIAANSVFAVNSFYVNETGIYYGYYGGLKHWRWDGTLSPVSGTPSRNSGDEVTLAYDPDHNVWWSGGNYQISPYTPVYGSRLYKWEKGAWRYTTETSSIIGYFGGSAYIWNNLFVVGRSMPTLVTAAYSIVALQINDSGGYTGTFIEYEYSNKGGFTGELPDGKMGPGPFNHLWVTSGYGPGRYYFELGGSNMCGNGYYEPELGEECDISAVSVGESCPVGFRCNMIPKFSDSGTPLCTCVVDSCGDGVLDVAFGETCDSAPWAPCDKNGDMINDGVCDMNTTAEGDADDYQCVCKTIVCGNGIREGPEGCDDANAANTDACLNNCTSAKCGDGYVYSGVEECDDNNTISGDGCSTTCTIERCGNGRRDAGEGCDTSGGAFDDCPITFGPSYRCNMDPNLAANCTCFEIPNCGDGRVQIIGEDCDTGGPSGPDIMCSGSGEICNMDPANGATCRCMPIPGAKRYAGEFVGGGQVIGTIGLFDISFRDKSSGVSSVNWEFRVKTRSDNCTGATNLDALFPTAPPRVENITARTEKPLGQLVLETNPGAYCYVVLGAYYESSSGVWTDANVTAFALVDGISGTNLCPNCVVPEIPSVTPSTL